LRVISRLLRHACEVDPLGKLPRFDTEEEEERRDEDDPPFPADTSVSEDIMIDDRDIQDREDGKKTSYDSPEQELVAPNIRHPLGKVPLTVRLHAKEAPTHVNHFPSQEKREPGKAGKAGSAGSENRVTSFGIGRIAILSQITIAKSVQDEGEGGQTEGCYPETIDDHIDHDFDGEDTPFQLSHELDPLHDKKKHLSSENFCV
jgi:hypothetical protein